MSVSTGKSPSEKLPMRRPSIVAYSNDEDQPIQLNPADPADTLNPQNWSSRTKRLVFLALMSSSILADGGMTWGASLVVPQAIQWHTSVVHSATSLNYGILLQGIGGLLAVPLIEAYGRLPLWLWPQVITTGVVIGCCFAPDFASFTAMRSLQGLFGTIPQIIGLPIIYDMYAPTEWPAMINIWGTTFLVGPFAGPALAGYLLTGLNWQSVFAVLAGLYGLSTILVLAFGRETYYNSITQTQQRDRYKAMVGIGNTNLPKSEALRESVVNIMKLMFTPALLLVGLSSMVDFTWPIGITTTIDAFLHSPPYLLDNIAAASMRWAGVIGALIGFAFGLWFNDWIYEKSEHRQNFWRSEYRLYGVWLPLGSMVAGLLIYGMTLNYGKSWVGLAIGWVMVVTGLVAETVAVSAFALEKYSRNATAVAAILNMWRVAGGFSVGYFQPSWIAKVGTAAVFGTQAAIVAVSAVVFVVPVIIMGRQKAFKRRASI